MMNPNTDTELTYLPFTKTWKDLIKKNANVSTTKEGVQFSSSLEQFKFLLFKNENI